MRGGAHVVTSAGALSPVRPASARARSTPMASERGSARRSSARAAARAVGAVAAADAAGPSTSAAAADGGSSSPQVVLTRESGKNGPLLKALRARGVACLELPLVETAAGPDRAALPAALLERTFDWVCLTSPESASVFMEGWRLAGRPEVRVAVVGEGTARILNAEGVALKPKFTPSVANAEHFGPELPMLPGGTGRVLYPASNKASSELQAGLAARGFDVLRLNTYDTLPVTELPQPALAAAKRAAVVAIASPSAVKAWVALTGGEAGAAVACIGSTSARAAEKLGLQRIYFPQNPGVDGFVDSIMQALQESGSAGGAAAGAAS